MNDLQIAKTILQQIGGRRLMALGAQNQYSMGPGCGFPCGGVQFTASLFGQRRCKVVVELTPADLYKVTITRPIKGEVIFQADGVFCEDLGDQIETACEKWFASK